MADYGFDGNMSALDWLGLMGAQGVSNLRAEDLTQLKEAGIISEKGKLHTEQLALAIAYREKGYVICDAVGKKGQKTDVLAVPQCQPHEKDFGLGRHHRFNQ